MAAEFCLRNITARKVLLHAVNLRHGTDGFTSPPKEGVLFITLKNRPGSNPRTLGPVASTLTTSPPRATEVRIYFRLNQVTYSTRRSVKFHKDSRDTIINKLLQLSKYSNFVILYSKIKGNTNSIRQSPFTQGDNRQAGK
jgi:hypothetical protein